MCAGEYAVRTDEVLERPKMLTYIIMRMNVEYIVVA